ncbi:MAG: glycosyltransferase family 2 protein [Candidatus Anammoxibacter sp.]
MIKNQKEEPCVAIIILNLNQKDYTVKCLESLFKINYLDFKVVLIDNGSTDDSAEAIVATFPDVHLIKNNRNIGVAGGRNVGIKYANEFIPYDYLLFLDNDTVVEKEFLSELVKASESDTDVGLAFAKIYDISNPQLLQYAGKCNMSFYTCSIYSEAFNVLDKGQVNQPQYSMIAFGCSMLAKREVVLKLKCFDEIFNPYGEEDVDFSLRAGRAGFKILYVPTAVIYHKLSKTSIGGAYNETFSKLKGKHFRILMQRYASPFQKVCFYCFLPFVGMRTLIREARRGNHRAVIALFKSFFLK